MNTLRHILLNWILALLMIASSMSVNAQHESKKIKLSKDELRDKMYASWLGQMVGNIYGLPHENKYIDEPGPDQFPYGYTTNLERLKKTNGAFSDDDTDIEYIYLLQMKKYGPEPTYLQLTDAWKYHIRKNVWLANRAALGLMHVGYTPPYTGSRELNPHWFQIDPQLVNEIWGVTAPGMITYAAEKSAWAARITNDGWGIEPTIHYGAMFAAAFVESDVNKVIDIGLAALPADSRFAGTVQFAKSLYRKYPDNWQQARKEIAKQYYTDEPIETKTIWNANLNGACGILALLYGQGDFQRTLDLSCAMGFDADNQAATMCGLLALMGGTQSIPHDLLYPIKADWVKPFNDIYKNVSRYDMPDATITSMAEESLAQAKAIILKHGGTVTLENGKEYFHINTQATFLAPPEISTGPAPLMETGHQVNASLGFPGQSSPRVVKGKLPTGIKLVNGSLTGTPAKSGVYPVTIGVDIQHKTVSRAFQFLVRGKNLSAEAVKIISNVTETNTMSRDSMWLSVSKELYDANISTIRDGKRTGRESVFYSIDGSHHPKEDYYGYLWNADQTIGLIGYSMGSMEENGGWFTSLRVEYQATDGTWKPVTKTTISPALVANDEPYNKPHFTEYILTFEPVKTRGIRIIGDAGADDHWYSKKTWFTSITELSVYEPIPGIEALKERHFRAR